MNDRVRPGEGGVVVRPVLTFDPSFDHRAVDGADDARFPGALAENVETAERHDGES